MSALRTQGSPNDFLSQLAVSGLLLRWTAVAEPTVIMQNNTNWTPEQFRQWNSFWTTGRRTPSLAEGQSVTPSRVVMNGEAEHTPIIRATHEATADEMDWWDEARDSWVPRGGQAMEVGNQRREGEGSVERVSGASTIMETSDHGTGGSLRAE